MILHVIRHLFAQVGVQRGYGHKREQNTGEHNQRGQREERRLELATQIFGSGFSVMFFFQNDLLSWEISCF